MSNRLPVLGVCGFSGSGKTTLIEQVLPRLQSGGLSVCAVKHDAHGLDVDRPGKDSDRFFRAGADVVLRGPGEQLLRGHRTDEGGLDMLLADLARKYDLVLVEGHKATALPKVWLLGDDDTHPPAEVSNVLTVLPRGPERLDAFEPLVRDFLSEQWLKTPMLGCVLIGGQSRRMGRPKHLIERDGRTWLEWTIYAITPAVAQVVLVGAGAVPGSLDHLQRLPDAPGLTGPAAGVLSAMRWAPEASWLIAACDLPDISAEAFEFLAAARAPGVWATMPQLPGADHVEPLLAHYDFRAQHLLEAHLAQGRSDLCGMAKHPKVTTPCPPEHLQRCWRNVNSPQDLDA